MNNRTQMNHITQMNHLTQINHPNTNEIKHKCNI